ncbi:MAG: pilus assembly protein TadG-related protein [Acidimicrobiia bacterium]
MRRLTEDRGASGVLVAILLVALLAMAGFAIDAAALYQERRELRNGADAAVLAIAEDCGIGILPCDKAYAGATAQYYADVNASDGAAGVGGVLLDQVTRTVSLTTSTLEADTGSTIFEPYFLQVVGYDGTTVRASATAAWGYPGSLPTLPLIISDCEWLKVTLQSGPPFSGSPTKFFFHDGNPAEPCNAQAGLDKDQDGFLPSGFGWLGTTGVCEAQSAKGQWVGEDPGSSPSKGCSAARFRDEVYSETVILPFFSDVDGIQGQGANGRYLVAGFGAFYVTGYNFGGLFKAPSAATAPCSGDERCIAGYFTTATVFVGGFGGDDRGVVLVKLID